MSAERRDPVPHRPRRIAVLAAAAVAIALALALAGCGGGGGDAASPEETNDARAALEAAGCELKVVKAVEADHSITNPDDESPTWNTTPPTSGPHYGETLLYGSYNEPIQQARALHNLEHGAITVQYGDEVPESTVEQLRAFYDENRNGTIMAPLPTLGDRIALAAWNAPNTVDVGQGVLATCPGFDEDAYDAYFAAFQFKGPERFSPDSMLPGQN
jgi:hypothetical protein